MLYESPNFRLEADDQILTLWLDLRGRSAPTWTLPLVNELSLVLDRIAARPADVLVVRGSRPGRFLEEFDVADLDRLDSVEVAAMATRGQDLCRKLAGLAIPTVAVVDGRCRGAGLEFALACDVRLAVDGPATEFAADDRERGSFPCWGGTVRLVRRVGLRAGLDLLSSGRIVTAVEAVRLGLADRITTRGRLAIDLRLLCDELQDRPRKNQPTSPLWQRLFPGLARFVAPREAEWTEVVLAGIRSEGEGLAAERSAAIRSFESDRGRSLRVLHARATAPFRVFPEPVNPVAPLPNRIGIVGGGELGCEIAVRLARHGHEVLIQDRDPDVVARRLANRVGAEAVRATGEWHGFDNAEFAIVATDEDPGIQLNLFQQLEQRARPRTILATAGTTVAIEAIQAEMHRPGRIAGLHFPNLLDRHAIAEIVGTSTTDPGTVAALGQWSRRWGLTPVRVADRPGRLVTHVLLTYLAEGVALVAEGLPPDRIDTACRRFGFAKGPLEWCDEVGLDRVADLVAQMQLVRGDSFGRNLLFHRLLPYGVAGKATGEGFYRYGRRQTPNELARMILWRDLDEDAIAHYVFDPEAALRDGLERIVLRTVNEAAALLPDEPDADPGAVDLALAWGMNWAVARGGPLRYADGLGLPNVADRLALFSERFGPRFTPCDELMRRAEVGESFHGTPVVEEPARVLSWRVAA